ncbi:MAG TPA: DUF58 domain-containing protein [Methylomirabilota bacterium]|nr:DUF58 domain-containing protein [Methylomirabilota bacterium]
MRPTPIAVALVGAGLLLALPPALGFPHLAFLLAGFWAVLVPLLLLDAALAPRRGGLSWRLETPEILHVGVPHPIALVARLPGHARGFEARLDTSGVLSPLPTQRGAADPEGTRVTWDLFAPRRGEARIEALWMRFQSPLRLWQSWVSAPLGRGTTVLPDVPRVKAAALRFFSERELRTGLKTERYIGDGSEFDSLKEFVRGDDRRAIDWKSSARHRRLLARHHRAERNHRVILTLDTGRLMSESLGALTRLDHAIHGALLLAHACLRAGDQVGLFTFDARARMAHPPAGGIGELHALIAAAARVQYSHEESNFTLGLTQLGQTLSRRSLIVLLTEFADTVSATLMMENVARLVRRHVVVFVTLRDPGLDRATRQAPDSLDALSAAVVTRGLRRERDRVHLELRRLGVRALDVTPDRVAPELISEYLEVRRRELV